MRIKISLSYDGTWFYGWAIQPKLPTIQGIIEKALKIITGYPIHLVVAGRTDTGVHAREQVAHFDIHQKEWLKLTSNSTNKSQAFIRRINSLIQLITIKSTGIEVAKNSICILSAHVVSKVFDARFSALWRKYSYTINDSVNCWNPLERLHVLHYKRKLDEDAMNEASKFLLGKNDFAAFSKFRENASTIRILHKIFWKRHENYLIMSITADAFCHHMVRSLVGAFLLIGDGRRKPEWIHKRLLSRERNAEANTAPSKALVLENICYPTESLWHSRTQLTRSKRK